MTDRNSTARLYFAMTLVEMLIAMALLLVVFAAIVPQIRAIQNSWASKRQNVEVIQNGRVLMDHITFNLTQAQKITAVSDSSETNGYVEFEDNDGNTMRYEIGAGNLVQFGPVGSLSELAGPVSQLQFTCYDACDLDTPIADVNQVRSVKAQATFTNSAALGRDHTFTAQAYLRTNSLGGGGGGGKTVSEEPLAEFEFDASNGQNPVLCRIDASHHLCVYKGFGGAAGKAWAVVLIVNSGNWTITKGLPFLFDSKACGRPDLKRIDAENYLCAYTGDKGDGYAVILTVDTVTDTVTMGTPFEFDPVDAGGVVLSRIDSDDYLCAYSGFGGDGMAVILTVDTVTRTITKGPTFVFDGTGAGQCALSNIDNVHHLCTYSVGAGGGGGGAAIILTTDTVSKTVIKEAAFFTFDPDQAMHNELQEIDQNHHLLGYRGWGETGKAVILTVDTGTWAIGKGTTIQYDDKSEYPAFGWITGSDFLLAYAGQRPSEADIGKAMVMTVDTQTDSVSTGSDFIHDNVEGVAPALSKVDDSHFLCAYEGVMNDGFATILTIGSRILP